MALLTNDGRDAGYLVVELTIDKRLEPVTPFARDRLSSGCAGRSVCGTAGGDRKDGGGFGRTGVRLAAIGQGLAADRQGEGGVAGLHLPVCGGDGRYLSAKPPGAIHHILGLVPHALNTLIKTHHSEDRNLYVFGKKKVVLPRFPDVVGELICRSKSHKNRPLHEQK